MDFQTTESVPPFAEWPSLAEANRENLRNLAYIDFNREEFRREIFGAAAEYINKLGLLADRADLALPRGTLPGYDGRQVIIASGHQPVLYHSGLIYKNILLSRFIRENRAAGINVIVDTDQGADLVLPVPVKRHGYPSVREIPVYRDSVPFLFQKIPDFTVVRGALNEAEESLKTAGLSNAADNIAVMGRVLSRLAGQPVTDVNTLLRRSFEPQPAYLELPLSELLKNRQIKEVFRSIVSDYAAFTGLYNDCLDEFRKEYRIKNAANPFPNLKTEAGSFELPFWLVDADSQTRKALSIRAEDGKYVLFADGERVSESGDPGSLPYLCGSGRFLAPKALLVTVILRLFLSDFFVHGLGGAKYDRLTDIFIERYFQIKPPAFAAASASNYIYNRERIEYEKSREEAVRKREIYFHPEKYLDRLGISEEDSATVTELSARKAQLIEAVKRGKQEKVSTASLTQDIKQAEKEVRAVLEKYLNPADGEAKDLPKSVIEDLYYREAPFFYFYP